MSEPIYCAICGAEDWDCDHSPGDKDYAAGSFCELCGGPSAECSCEELLERQTRPTDPAPPKEIREGNNRL